MTTPDAKGAYDADPTLNRISGVCPRCSNGRPTCTDRKPDGSTYGHAETCATYDWTTDVCGGCLADIAAGGDR